MELHSNVPTIVTAVAVPGVVTQRDAESAGTNGQKSVPEPIEKAHVSEKPPELPEKVPKKVLKNKKRKEKVTTCGKCAHNIFTHFPKDKHCDICNASKIQNAACKTKADPALDSLPEPEAFGDALTADHAIINEDDKSRSNDRVALVIQDRKTHWLQAYPFKTKSAKDTVLGFQRFMGPLGKAKYVYSDNSPEIKAAMKELNVLHDTSIPYRPQTNGIAERAVRRVKEGTTCTLVQSGLGEEWWAEAMECYTYLRCIVDIMKEDMTSYQLRFGAPFEGPIIPFGAHVKYKPSNPKHKARLPKFGEKVLDGIFMGYKINAGGGWSKQLKVADWEDIERNEHQSTVLINEIHYQEVIIVRNAGGQEDDYTFPVKNDTLVPASGDLIKRGRPRKIPKTEEQEKQEADVSGQTPSNVLEEPSARDLTVKHEEPVFDESRDSWTVTNDVLIRHHKSPRMKLFEPKEDDTPIPIKFLDVMRRTHTNLEDKSESTIEDCWNEEDSIGRELSAPWTGKTISIYSDQTPSRDGNGLKEEKPKSKQPQDLTAYGQKYGNY